MSGSNVPTIALTDTGYVVPAESAILAGALADINAAFGGGLVASLSTPQGQLATSLAALIGSQNGQLALLLNAYDPARATGRIQDAIARLAFLERQASRPTVVPVVCAGKTGVVIPAGALVESNSGDTYVIQASGTIGGSGTVTLSANAFVPGPLACPIGSITRIVKAIGGWDSVTNLVEGVIGITTENAKDFERRRAASVTINSRGPYAPIQAALLAAPGVLDAYVTGNNSGTAITKGGVSIKAHSVYASVAGGAPADVGYAIFSKISPCDMTGSTTVTVQDTAAQATPYPTYAISYDVAAPTPIKVTVQMTNSLAVPADAQAQVQAAVLAAFVGADKGPRARIGQPLLSSRFYAGIAALGPWVQLVSVLIGTTAPGTQTSVTLPINQVPTMSAADITLELM